MHRLLELNDPAQAAPSELPDANVLRLQAAAKAYATATPVAYPTWPQALPN